MADDIRQIPIQQLHPREVNPNKMDRVRYDALVAAYRRRGCLQPLLARMVGADSYEVIDGAHRLRAGVDAGLEALPCVLVKMPDAEAKAFQVSMNRIRGEQDLTMVAQFLNDLHGMDWSLPQLCELGFEDEEVAALLDMATVPDPTAMPTDADWAGDHETPSETMGEFVLEVHFTGKGPLTRARRVLRRLAGKGAPLADGLNRLIEIWEENK